MWSEIKLWLIGATWLFAAVLACMLLAELINLRWHDLGASAGASAVILLMLVLARLMAGIWLDIKKTQREYDERHRQFEERQRRVGISLREAPNQTFSVGQVSKQDERYHP